MSPKRVMIVEDEPITAMDEHEILTNLGYEVVGMTFTGKAALSQVREAKPDVVLMDVVLLGDMNGMDAARVIQRDYHIPVVIVTALGRSLMQLNAPEQHSLRIVEKPYTEETLAAAIEAALEGA